MQRTPVAQVFQWLNEQLGPLSTELVPVTAATGRILSRAITSEVAVPAFARAMMDGYGVLAVDTAGASPYNVLPLKVVDQALPGRPATQTLQRGQAIRIMTGAPLPDGADAVLPAEEATSESDRVLVHGETTPGQHVGAVGEDIAAGSLVLQAGRCLRPQDVGVLASIGLARVPVVRCPTVRIVVTGNELLPAGTPPSGVQIVDSNGPMLTGLVHRDGGQVVSSRIIPDDADTLRAALHEEADLILVAGGSSVGQEDHAPRVLAAEGTLVFHGIAMRPSSPTGLGTIGGRLVFLLPGNPVSCLCAYDFFAGCAIRVLGGRRWEWPYPRIRRPLHRKVASVVGRVDYARVRVVNQQIEPLAIGGASVLSSTTRADGFLIVPENSEGFPAGADVDVYLYDL